MPALRSFTLVIFLSVTCIAAVARAQGTTPPGLVQELQPGSSLAWGCFGPCECPVRFDQPLKGTYALLPAPGDPIFATYVVTDIAWTAASTQGNVSVTGRGLYRVSAGTPAQQELTLDVSVGGAPTQHFDSGLQPITVPFPRISVSASLHGLTCQDSVFTIVSAPVATEGAGDGNGALAFRVFPDPTRAGATTRLELPAGAFASVRVCDLAGRTVRTVAARRWLAAGAHEFTWDGLDAAGRTAPAGLYFVRAEIAGESRTRTLVRLR